MIVLENLEQIVRPATLQEAASVLRAFGDRAAVLAGGTALASAEHPEIRVLVDLSRLALDRVRATHDGLSIGAGITLEGLRRDPAVRGLADGVLAEAAGLWRNWQIRNAATLGGHLVTNPAGADLPAVLLALDASVRIQDGNSRVRPFSEFFDAPLRGEILTEVLVPAQPDATRYALRRQGRTMADLSLSTVAVALTVAKGRCLRARVGLSGAVEIPRRLIAAEAALQGEVVDAASAAAAAAEAARDLRPIDDFRGSAEYRRRLTEVLCRRAILAAAEKFQT